MGWICCPDNRTHYVHRDDCFIWWIKSVLNSSTTLKPHTTLFTNRSWMVSSTKRMPAAMQFSPLLKNTELMPWNTQKAMQCLPLQLFHHQKMMKKQDLTMRTALSMSQSLKMMRGDFPPSSRETLFTLLTAQLYTANRDTPSTVMSYAVYTVTIGYSHLFMICFPISVEPVKPSLRTSGWSDRRWPTTVPRRGRRRS